MLDSVQSFLSFFKDAPPAEGRTPEQLCAVLDRLLVAYQESPDIAPDTDMQPPSHDFRKDRDVVQRCFPNFGLYRWCDPKLNSGSQALVGDAIDDLADIYSELRGVDWLLTNASLGDAIWQFRHSFESHWGRHLLNLRSYLHCKLHEAP